MTYFQLYDLPISLNINPQILRKKYYQLCGIYHPDKVDSNDANAQKEAIEKTAIINEAYKTLGNKDLTLHYILQQKNIIVENETYKLDNAFLMEMMELNEQIMEAKLEANPQQTALLKEKINSISTQLLIGKEWIFEKELWNEISEEEQKSVLEYYYQKKYIRRLWQQINDDEVEM